MLLRPLSALGLLVFITLSEGCGSNGAAAVAAGGASTNPTGNAGANSAGADTSGGAAALGGASSIGGGGGGGEIAGAGASASGGGADLLQGPKPCTDETEQGAATASAGARTVKVGGKGIGKTAAAVGFSATDVNATSNAVLWARYSGATTFRTFGAVPPQKQPADAGFGDGVTTSAAFSSSRKSVSSAPEASPLLDLKYIASKIQSGKAAGTLAIAAAVNAPMVVEIKTRADDYPLDHAPSSSSDWKSNWEVWKNYFGNAFVYARDYGASRFEIYNEPDLTIDAFSSLGDYAIRARLAGDAIQQAVQAANAVRKASDPNAKDLVPLVIAPTSATGTSKYTYGQELVAERNAGPLGSSGGADYTLFQGYGYHSYGSDGLGSYTTVRDIQKNVLEPQSLTLPWFITEFNANTNAQSKSDLGTQTYACDIPDYARRLTEKSIGYSESNVGPMNLFAFNFLSNEDDSTTPSTITNNGLYWATPAPGSIIGGDSLAAVAYRLLTQHFNNGLDLLGLQVGDDPADKSGKAPDTLFEATYDAADDAFFILASNRATETRTVFYDLSALSLPAGTLATVIDVDALHHGEVTHRITLSDASTFEITQQPNAITLVSVPKSAGTPASVGAVADATLAPGAQSGARFGDDMTLTLAADSTNTSKLRTALLSFRLPDVPEQKLGEALLELSVTPASPTSTAADVIHIYGIADNAFSDDAQAGVRWSDVPNLRALADGSKYAKIQDNAIVYTLGGKLDPDLRIAGSALLSGGLLRVDVTAYLREQIALKRGRVSLLLVREVNHHQETIAYAASFRSRESACGGPSLSMRFFH